MMLDRLQKQLLSKIITVSNIEFTSQCEHLMQFAKNWQSMKFVIAPSMVKNGIFVVTVPTNKPISSNHFELEVAKKDKLIHYMKLKWKT